MPLSPPLRVCNPKKHVLSATVRGDRFSVFWATELSQPAPHFESRARFYFTNINPDKSIHKRPRMTRLVIIQILERPRRESYAWPKWLFPLERSTLIMHKRTLKVLLKFPVLHEVASKSRTQESNDPCTSVHTHPRARPTLQ